MDLIRYCGGSLHPAPALVNESTVPATEITRFAAAAILAMEETA
jgi:hypothetical protein